MIMEYGVHASASVTVIVAVVSPMARVDKSDDKLRDSNRPYGKSLLGTVAGLQDRKIDRILLLHWDSGSEVYRMCQHFA